jgi:hypothetical protein
MWEEKLRRMEREIKAELGGMEQSNEDACRAARLAEETLRTEQACKKDAEQQKMHLLGKQISHLTIQELEKLEVIQFQSQQRTRHRRDDLLHEDREALEKRVQKLEHDAKCKVCLERAADYVLVPCGHRICGGCCAKMAERSARVQAGGTEYSSPRVTPRAGAGTPRSGPGVRAGAGIALHCHMCRACVEQSIRIY